MNVSLQSDLGSLYRMNLSSRQAMEKDPALSVHIGLNKNVIPVNKSEVYKE